jgi:membrane protein YqaA with SNARE-associated domain
VTAALLLAMLGDVASGAVDVLLSVLAAGSHPLVAFHTVLEDTVRSATGPIGLVVIAVYSFLIAFVLPLPSEVVLAPAGVMRLGLSYNMTLAAIILVSGLGKAAGSVFAFHIGQEAKEYGPLVRRIRESRFDVIEWSERRTVQLAREFGYVGMAVALSVPFFPDTISIYAFTILERDYVKFALATFVGSVGRLLVTIGIVGSGAAVFF